MCRMFVAKKITFFIALSECCYSMVCSSVSNAGWQNINAKRDSLVNVGELHENPAAPNMGNWMKREAHSKGRFFISPDWTSGDGILDQAPSDLTQSYDEPEDSDERKLFARYKKYRLKGLGFDRTDDIAEAVIESQSIHQKGTKYAWDVPMETDWTPEYGLSNNEAYVSQENSSASYEENTTNLTDPEKKSSYGLQEAFYFAEPFAELFPEWDDDDDSYEYGSETYRTVIPPTEENFGEIGWKHVYRGDKNSKSESLPGGSNDMDGLKNYKAGDVDNSDTKIRYPGCVENNGAKTPIVYSLYPSKANPLTAENDYEYDPNRNHESKDSISIVKRHLAGLQFGTRGSSNENNRRYFSASKPLSLQESEISLGGPFGFIAQNAAEGTRTSLSTEDTSDESASTLLSNEDFASNGIDEELPIRFKPIGMEDFRDRDETQWLGIISNDGTYMIENLEQNEDIEENIDETDESQTENLLPVDKSEGYLRNNENSYDTDDEDDDSVRTDEIHEPGFYISNADFCPNEGKNLKLLIIVDSM